MLRVCTDILYVTLPGNTGACIGCLPSGPGFSSEQVRNHPFECYWAKSRPEAGWAHGVQRSAIAGAFSSSHIDAPAFFEEIFRADMFILSWSKTEADSQAQEQNEPHL